LWRTQTRLEREAIRLSALLEAARAQAQVRGVPMRWRVTPQGFQFEPDITLEDQAVPTQWLDQDTRAQVVDPVTGLNADALLLGPDPIIGAQGVVLSSVSQPEQRLRLATDGLRPFAVPVAAP
jgi:general secretion pathway protein H